MTESATLDFPPIVEPPQAPTPTAIAVAPKSVVTIKEAAVAHLRAHEPTILALAERYRGVALPLDTPKGLAAGMGLDLGGAIADKLAFNAARADHRPENRKAAGGKAF